MKKLFSLLVMAMFAIASSAQITWNVKGGIGMATAEMEGAEVDLKFKLVGKIGVGIEKPINNNWSVMPSLELALKGAKSELIKGSDKLEETMSLTYLQLPILAAYRMNISDFWNVAFKAGPYVGYALSGNYEYKETYGGINDSGDYDMFDEGDAKRFDAGIIIGADFEYQRYVIGAEFEYGLTSISAYDDVELTNSAIYVTFGYKF